MGNGLIVVVYVTITILPIFLGQLLKTRHKNKRKAIVNKADREFYHEIVFLNMRNFNCKPHLYKKIECSNFCSYIHLNRLVNFISSATKTISMCMYMLTAKDVSEILIKAHNQGIRVRIISDKVMSNNIACHSSAFLDAGIPFIVQKCDNYMMHHKFCLIDEEDEKLAKIFFGSLNLTYQGLATNFDFLVFSSNLNIIKRYSEEFEDLWGYL